MSNFFQKVKEVFLPKKHPLPVGMYSYQTPPEAEQPYRLHLRIEKDGTGLLVINASTILHLNQTAAEFAFHIVRQTDFTAATREISRRYKGDPEQIRLDLVAFMNQIDTMITTPDLDPVSFLDIERQEPYSGEISAPYRLDCALTYQVTSDSNLEDAPTDRVDRELSTEEWFAILDKACNAGIPHILFTGGEPTLREDLPQLVQKAEDLGLVTGLLSDGKKLGNEGYRKTLLESGLDHLMMVFNPNDAQEWEVLKKILAEDLFTTVHLTLRKGDQLDQHIEHLARIGANALSLSAADPDLENKLQGLRDTAAVQQLELVWDIPVPYSGNNPVALELAHNEDQEPPQGAGKAWLYVEPDGDVLPAQGMYEQVLGNFLTDSWETIWSKK